MTAGDAGDLSSSAAAARGRLVVLSPHIDDAVLSCAGALLTARRLGWSTEVWTVFSESTEPEETATRRREDAEATRLLGASPRWLGAPDKLARAGGRVGFEELFFADDPTADAIARDVLRPVLAGGRATVLAPLGVGGHVDHRAVFRAVSALSAAGAWCYEDRPYATLEVLVRLRLVELGWLAKSAGPATADVLAALRSARFVGRHYPRGDRLRRLSEAVSTIVATAREDPAPPARCCARITGDAVENAFAAQQAYRSQVRAIARGRAEFDVAAAAVTCRIIGRQDEGYVEQYWRLDAPAA